MTAHPRYDAKHDFAAKWPPMPDWSSDTIDAGGLRVMARVDLHQVLISGNLAEAATALASDAQEVGLWSMAARGTILIRIARDRGLLVSQTRIEVSDGWNANGWCATDMSDAYRVFDISGPSITDLVARAVSANFQAGSPSAAVLFAGAEALLYRCGDSVARLHVEQPLGGYIWRWLEEQAKAMNEL